MMANQIENSKLKQRSLIKCLVAEKYKPCEIYRKLCDVYRKACFILKTLYELAEHGFATSRDSLLSGNILTL